MEEEEKCEHTIRTLTHTYTRTCCFYVIYSYTLLSTPLLLLPLNRFPLPLPLPLSGFLSSFIFSIHSVCREEFYMKLRRTHTLAHIPTPSLAPPLPLRVSLALTQRQISLPACLPSLTPPHTHFICCYT